jgi:D-lactate dehydrogenase (cytochrome)
MDVEGPHSVVVYPTSTEDVVKIVKIATKHRMPVTPYSGATSLEGHYRGVRCSVISLDFPLIETGSILLVVYALI